MKLSLSCKLPTHGSSFCLGYSVSKNGAIHLVKWKTMIEMRFTAQLWEIIKMRGRLFKPPTASREAAKGLLCPGWWQRVQGIWGHQSRCSGAGRGLAGQGLGAGGSPGQSLVVSHPPSCLYDVPVIAILLITAS